MSRLDDIFSKINALVNWCQTELKRSTTMRQSILKAAFSGKLVPQDPSDETAGELLRRIQVRRASKFYTTNPNRFKNHASKGKP